MGFVAVEILGMLSPAKAFRIGHMAHLGGYLAGSIWAFCYSQRVGDRRQEMG